ncbi:SET and MYND domain-containing protein 3 [Halocaridina rubra]|uniref:SET and MYND domain-containing protein 3 n=1 Tax=Halocaridina rubra TaxID=373956 RepID=A0AAN8ZWB2_HALRR
MNTGAVLLYHAAQLYCNLYKVTDFQAKETAGIGVYSALSLINHSCYPSVKHYFIGRSLVMRAVRPISAGEELTISYIKPFQKAKKQERKILLQRYWFSCTCEACVNDWPTFPNLPALRFKCLGCKNPLDGRPRVCYACVTKRRDPDKPQTEQMEVVDSIWRGILNACCTDLALNIGQKKTREDYLTVCQNLQLLYEHVAMPCQHVIIMHQLLYKYFEDEF